MHLRAGTQPDPTSMASNEVPELVYYVGQVFSLGATSSEPFKGCFSRAFDTLKCFESGLECI